MTLAERLCEHCTPPAQADGYGALLGATFPLRKLLDRFLGRTAEIASGVSVAFPHNCEWKTSDLADGSVQITFSDPPPRVTAQHSVLRVSADVPAIILRLGAAAIEAQIQLRRFPDFNLTIPLRGGGDSESE